MKEEIPSRCLIQRKGKCIMRDETAIVLSITLASSLALALSYTVSSMFSQIRK